MSAIESFEQALADEGYAERTIYLYCNYVRRAMRRVPLDGASRDQLAVFVRDLGPGARRQARKSLAAYYRIRTGRNPALELPPSPPTHRGNAQPPTDERPAGGAGIVGPRLNCDDPALHPRPPRSVGEGGRSPHAGPSGVVCEP